MTHQPYPSVGEVWAGIHRALATAALLPVLLAVANATHAAMNVEQVLSAPYFEEIDIRKTRAGKRDNNEIQHYLNAAPGLDCPLEGYRGPGQGYWKKISGIAHEKPADRSWHLRVTAPLKQSIRKHD